VVLELVALIIIFGAFLETAKRRGTKGWPFVVVSVFSGLYFRRRAVRAVFGGAGGADGRGSLGRSLPMFVVFLALATAVGAGTDRVAVGKVIRDPVSGDCSLVATSSSSPVDFEVSELWRYDPPSKRWLRQEFKPVSKVVQSGNVGSLTNEAGLYWVKWKENGDPCQSLVTSGRVLCNDIHLAPSSEPDVIAACIPFEDSARAEYVPDPEIHCK
jgi:hypothetical protein